jgi:hypothetical protein
MGAWEISKKKPFPLSIINQLTTTKEGSERGTHRAIIVPLACKDLSFPAESATAGTERRSQQEVSLAIVSW